MTKLQDSRTIKMISYLSNGERKTVVASSNGTFILNTIEVRDGRKRMVKRELTAREFSEHPDIMYSDPVITLKTGEKIRVYDGGDPSYLPAMSEGIMEKNDRFEVLRRKFLKQKQDREDTRRANSEKNNTTDEYANPFAGWDLDYYD